MNEAQQEQVAQWLREGLDAYGIDDVDAAIAAWQQVLAVDPENAEARDYIEAAGRTPAAPAEEAPEAAEAGAASSVLEETAQLVALGQLEDAWALLEGVTTGMALDGPTAAFVDLLRARLVPHYRKRLGPDCVPKLIADSGSLEQFNLPPGAGHLISLCDGVTSVTEMVTLSGTDIFDALHNLNGLVDAGLVSVDV